MKVIHAKEHSASVMPSLPTSILAIRMLLIQLNIHLNQTGTRKNHALPLQVGVQTIHNAVLTGKTVVNQFVFLTLKKMIIFTQLVIVTKQAPLFYITLITKNVVVMDRSGQLASAKTIYFVSRFYSLWP